MHIPNLPLPYDLCEYVLKHLCAMCIQERWLRWRHFSHARDRRWSTVRREMGRETWRRLIPYEHVRREWRQEMSSWLSVRTGTLDVIVQEAYDGYWGSRASRL